jgi:hypothetical protein
MMTAVLIAMLVIMGAAATGATGQAYPGPSQRIEPTQPMQSMQPIQPMAPLPTPPMSAPGDSPGNQTTAPQAGSSGGSSPTPEPPASSSGSQRPSAPADMPTR